MFDIGFWELLVIAVVLLLVMGPERLPEVARQAAFLVRKARQGMYRLRSEMRSEMDSTPFADLQKARQEMTGFKNDIKQFGRELADSAGEIANVDDGGGAKTETKKDIAVDTPIKEKTTRQSDQKVAEKPAGKKVKSKLVSKKKVSKKKVSKKTVGKKAGLNQNE